jgi:DNA-binding CsgD family transcriptional regulator
MSKNSKKTGGKKKEPGWFYCMENKACPGIYKLGKSKELKHREKTMMHDAPFISVQKAAWVSDMHEMERKMHREYKDYKKCRLHKKGVGYELGVKDTLEKLTSMLLASSAEDLESNVTSLIEELQGELDPASDNYQDVVLRGEWFDLRDKDVYDNFVKTYGLIDREFIIDLRGKKDYDYDPYKSIEEIAKANNVRVPTIRKYIREKKIDRNRDEQMIKYNLVWKTYIKEPSISIAKLARKVGLSENTVKYYLNLPSSIKPKNGKIGLVEEDKFVATYRMNYSFINKT